MDERMRAFEEKRQDDTIKMQVELMEWEEKRDRERKSRQQEIADMQRQAAREMEEAMKRATQPMIDALESFRNLTNSIRPGQSDAFAAQRLASIERHLEDIRRQQVRL
jgi:serine kinase of HPr protein (carbohydrate metabolism regulator)